MTRLLVIAATVLAAATFGFFYAWIMVMWGLDTLDPASVPSVPATVASSVGSDVP